MFSQLLAIISNSLISSICTCADLSDHFRAVRAYRTPPLYSLDKKEGTYRPTLSQFKQYNTSLQPPKSLLSYNLSSRCPRSMLRFCFCKCPETPQPWKSWSLLPDTSGIQELRHFLNSLWLGSTQNRVIWKYLMILWNKMPETWEDRS